MVTYNRRELRLHFVKLVHANKDMLFGRAISPAISAQKVQKWEEIRQEMIALGNVALEKQTAGYVRDTYWQNTRRAAVNKLNNVSNDGFTDPINELDEADQIVLDVIAATKNLEGTKVEDETGKIEHDEYNQPGFSSSTNIGYSPIGEGSVTAVPVQLQDYLPVQNYEANGYSSNKFNHFQQIIDGEVNKTAHNIVDGYDEQEEEELSPLKRAKIDAYLAKAEKYRAKARYYDTRREEILLRIKESKSKRTKNINWRKN